MGWLTRTRQAAFGGLLVALACAVTGCKEEGGVAVTAIKFEGNESVDSSQLQAILATKAGGWLPWSPKQYFDRPEFENDLGRIRRYYADRGFPDATISRVDVSLNDARTSVRITIAVNEGEPVLVERVRFDGFEVLDEGIRAQLAHLPLKADGRRDSEQLVATRQQARDLLLDNGFAYARVESAEQVSGPKRVTVVFTASPGPPTTFGPISVVGRTRVGENIILRELSFREGEVYRNSRIIDSQRRLASVDLLRFANIDGRAPESGEVMAIPVTITVAENPPRRLELGAGYGSEERARGSAEWSHLNFLGGGRRATVSGKYSFIDRGVRLSLTQPSIRRGLSSDFSASTWWTNEHTYTSRTYGGRLGLAYRIPGRGRGAASRRPADTLRAAYLNESLVYQIRPEALEDLSGFDELVALGLDPTTGRGNGRKAALNVAYERVATDDPLEPRKGYGTSLRFEIARPALGGTFSYNETLVEGRAYLPVRDRVVLAARARFGTIAATKESDVPFSERYFLGGSTSLRGWGRYQVAPLADGLPVGGRTMLDVSAELRTPITGPLGAVLFVDAGNVWAEDWDASVADLRTSAGVGVRYSTPIGLVRADVGVQINPIEGLLIDGQPEARRWRLHFSLGQAF